MPINKCQKDGKSGFKWGQKGKCFVYKSGDESSRKAAKKKAIKQGIRIEGPEKFSQKAHEITINKNEYDDIISEIREELKKCNMTQEQRILCDITISRSIKCIEE